MNITKEDLLPLIKQGLSTWKMATKLGVGQKAICRSLKLFGMKSGWKKKTYPTYFCLTCGKRITSTKFCSPKCHAEFRWNEYISTWLNKKVNRFKWGAIKKYLMIEQNNLCAICHMQNEWNDKKLVFVKDHIDGDHMNNWRDNLRMVCPNCDSQLPTFKSRNRHKNSGWKMKNALVAQVGRAGVL